MVISDTIQKIDTNSLNDDSIVLLIQHIGSVISTIDTLINSNNYLLGDSGLTHQLRTALSDILDFIRSNRQQIVNNQLIQNKLKSVITINNVILSDAIIRFKSFTIPSNPPIQVPDSPVDNTPFDINQISFDTLLDSYLSSSSFYFEYRDQGKDVFADILTRVIRSDISKRLVTYFIIHEFFRQESPQDQGPLTYLLQILRNKQVPVKLTSSIIEKLSSTLHHYISDEFLLDITLDQNLFKNQVKDEFSDIIPIALGLLRNRSDSAFLTDPSIKNFFSTIRVRKASRTKDKILTFYPLGTSRSRQRIRIRSFLHLTSEEYFALPNLESKFNQFYQLQKLITLNLPNLISNSNPVDLTQDPDINANSHSKDPDTVLFIHDLNHPDITYVNAEKYLSEVNSVRTYDAEAKRPTLHKEASSLSYNNFIHIILLNVVDILKSLSILQIGTIPVIRRGILDLSNKGRDTDSPYTFTLPSTTVYPKNVDDIYYKYIFNNIPDTSPQFETIQLKLKLFNDSSISYTLNFKNWLNRKIDKLSKQIDKLQQTNNLAIINNFEMTPVSPNEAEQKSFILAQKQRNLEYYKAQNKA